MSHKRERREGWSMFNCCAMQLGGGRKGEENDAENIYIAELRIEGWVALSVTADR
jgi:hypothetical protein